MTVLLPWLKPRPTIPKGYPPYTAKDFEKHFKVTKKQARIIENDYLSIFHSASKSEFAEKVLSAGRTRDLRSLSGFLISHYGFLSVWQDQHLTRFFANVASGIANQQRSRDLGITHAIWIVSGALEEGECASHTELHGQCFEVSTGLLVNGVYLWPGVQEGCSCISRSIIPAFGDTPHRKRKPTVQVPLKSDANEATPEKKEEFNIKHRIAGFVVLALIFLVLYFANGLSKY
jgi:hypothetical protein